MADQGLRLRDYAVFCLRTAVAAFSEKALPEVRVLRAVAMRLEMMGGHPSRASVAATAIGPWGCQGSLTAHSGNQAREREHFQVLRPRP